MARPETVQIEVAIPDIINAVIASLKEHETLVEVVRCKDCKHREGRECNLLPLGGPRCGVADDWFCADGERGEDDETD